LGRLSRELFTAWKSKSSPYQALGVLLIWLAGLVLMGGSTLALTDACSSIILNTFITALGAGLSTAAIQFISETVMLKSVLY